MASLCDFCGEQKSMIYCKSDAASLCLSCDRNIHSANALSRRHSRNLLCDRCFSQPATVRCIEESISLCQSCDWNGHGVCASASGHKRLTIKCYSGCPSSSELEKIWSFALEFHQTDSSCEQPMGLMSINENIASVFWGNLQQSSDANMDDKCKVNHLENVNTTNVHIGSCFTSAVAPVISGANQPSGSFNSTTPKVTARNSEDNFYDELTFENYDELFGESDPYPEHLFEDVGIDIFYEMKENPAANPNCQGEFVTKASSGQVKSIPVACNNAVSSDSMVSNKRAKVDSSRSIPGRQTHSSLSLTFSSLKGESSACDYQDCGVSSMIFMGEPSWYPMDPDTSIQTQTANRDNAVMRYKQKKQTRKFDKKIRYASRKARADSRRRVKGRFIKVGEAFDYDPLSQT